MSANIVKNQHYVSEFFLKNFANENQQVFECLVNEGKIYKTNINRSMSSKFTYEHKDLSQNTLENYFSKIESYVAPMITKFIDVVENQENNSDVAFNIIKQLLPKLLVFYYRSGALLHEYSSKYDTVTDEEKIESLISKIIDSAYLHNLASTITNNYEWSIIQSSNNNFVISDQYISTAALSIKSRFINITNRHMGLKDVIILIPISSKYYFVFYNGKQPVYIQGQEVCILEDYQTYEVNVAIINNSYYKCVSSKKGDLDELLTEFNLINPQETIAHNSSGFQQFILKKEMFYYKNDEVAFDFFISLRFLKYKNTRRNEVCPCSSGIKYKNCCLQYVQKAESIMNDRKRNVDPLTYTVNVQSTIEQSIDELFTHEEPKLLKDIKATERND